MILTRDETICMVLAFAKNHLVSSRTKLNKLLARLNLHFVPIEISFELNKYGSFSADLASVESGPYFDVQEYEYHSMSCQRYVLTDAGKGLVNSKVMQKVSKILHSNELSSLEKEIRELSELKAGDISDNEHRKLLVDVEDRHKLKQKLNEVEIDLLDLMHDGGVVSPDSIANIRLLALIEFSYHLIKYLNKVRFKRVEDSEYDFESHMLDYYFLYNIAQMIPDLQKQVKSQDRDEILINKYYQYIFNSVKKDYFFSVENPDLQKLIVN